MSTIDQLASNIIKRIVRSGCNRLTEIEGLVMFEYNRLTEIEGLVIFEYNRLT